MRTGLSSVSVCIVISRCRVGYSVLSSTPCVCECDSLDLSSGGSPREQVNDIMTSSVQIQNNGAVAQRNIIYIIITSIHGLVAL